MINIIIVIVIIIVLNRITIIMAGDMAALYEALPEHFVCSTRVNGLRCS